MTNIHKQKIAFISIHLQSKTSPNDDMPSTSITVMFLQSSTDLLRNSLIIDEFAVENFGNGHNRVFHFGGNISDAKYR